MSRTIVAIVAAAIAALALPALASAETYCVNAPDCVGAPQASVQEALTTAQNHAGDDVVRVGPRPEPYVGGFAYVQGGTDNDVELVGSGRGETVLASANGNPALTLGSNSSVSHLSLRVAPNQADAIGLALLGGSADDIQVTGEGVLETAQGIFASGTSTITASSVRLPGGIGVTAGAFAPWVDLDDTRVSARVGLVAKDGSTLAAYRVYDQARDLGAAAGGVGTRLWLHSSLLTTSGAEATGARFIGGAEGALTYSTVSRTSPATSGDSGVYETAEGAGTTTDLEVNRTTIDGYAKSVTRIVGVGASGLLYLHNSNYDAESVDLGNAQGLSVGPGNMDVDPRFVNQFPDSIFTPRSFALRADSELIDPAGSCISTNLLDLAGQPRLVNGDGDATCSGDIGAYEYQRKAPVAEFSADAASAGSPVGFDAGASDDADPGDESMFTYAWSFGDGQSGSGRNPSHVFAQGGDYQVTLTVRDPMGLQASASHVISVAGTGGTAGGAGGTAPGGDSAAPVISRLRVSPNRLRIGKALARLSSSGGQIRFALSEPARVTLRFASARTGKRKGALTLNARAGLNTVRFAGRLSRRSTLKPGAYRLTVLATDAAGNRAAAKRTSFTLLARR